MKRDERRAGRARTGNGWGAPLGLLALVILAGPRAAAADACAECGPPTIQELAASPGFQLDTRSSGSRTEKDFVLTDGAECDLDLTGISEVTILSAWLVLRGSGEVWNCPHSQSCDAMTASTV